MPDPASGFWIKDAQPGRWKIKPLTIVTTKHQKKKNGDSHTSIIYSFSEE